MLVMIDANLDFSKWRSTEDLPADHSSIRLKSLMDELFDKITPRGVSQLVTGATKIERGQTRTGLDHLYSNKPILCANSSYWNVRSQAIESNKIHKVDKHLPRCVRKRSFKHFDEEAFNEQLGDCNLGEILEYTDVNAAAELLVGNGSYQDSSGQIKLCTRSTFYKKKKLLQAERNQAQE